MTSILLGATMIRSLRTGDCIPALISLAVQEFGCYIYCTDRNKHAA
jgi:hypothetical protein